MPDFTRETLLLSRGLSPVAGVDEVGRGPLAGPVVAAAVILDPEAVPPGLADSKALTSRRREALFAELQAQAICATGLASVAEIDRMNILQASLLAMRRAVLALPVTPAHALVDGNRLPEQLPCPAEAVVGGDRTVASIAAASIVAKVTRDRLMRDLAARHPGYGWERNAGYGTKEHLDALKRLGATPEHRVSFRPVHNILYQEK